MILLPHLIVNVLPDSIAEEMEISTGDFLLTVNGKNCADVLDYRYLTHDELVTLEIEKPDGEIWELEIEKDEDEDLGLEFDKPLMDDARRCKNKCVFCFIDQLPPSLRESLYFKDDDARLSFLSGNYVTLTNVTREEAERIAFYHLSPLRISVHAMEPELRVKLTGNPNAGGLNKTLNLFNGAGITMHFQIVLCSGLNDGAHLDYSISELSKLRPGAASLSVVPAGLSRHREGLYPLKPFTQAEAAEVIAQVSEWQSRLRGGMGTAFVFCADEFYLQAGLPVPDYAHYEDFPQLENGVGMLALFKKGFYDAYHPAAVKRKTAIITGKAAAGFIRGLVKNIENVLVYEIENEFFGPLITVSGLLTGGDIIRQAGARVQEDGVERLFVPANAFRHGTEVMLDDVTLTDLHVALGLDVSIGPADGGDFYRSLIFSTN
jgi:putative radical SAM enzyme (TIGR03279 family)